MLRMSASKPSLGFLPLLSLEGGHPREYPIDCRGPYDRYRHDGIPRQRLSTFASHAHSANPRIPLDRFLHGSRDIGTFNCKSTALMTSTSTIFSAAAGEKSNAEKMADAGQGKNFPHLKPTTSTLASAGPSKAYRSRKTSQLSARN